MLAAGVFFAGPSTTYRARTSFTVPSPLVAADVMREIRVSEVKARSTGGQALEVESTGSNRSTTQRHVASAVTRGVDKSAGDVAANALLRAAAARAAETKAEADSAALVATTGLSDPGRAYRSRHTQFLRLQQQRDARRAAGGPTGDLDAKIAVAQQDVYDLQFLADHHDVLVQDQRRAAQDLAAATAAADGVRAAAESVKRELRVTAHRQAGWQLAAIPLALLALVAVLIAVVPLLTRRRRRRTPLGQVATSAVIDARVPDTPMTEADALLVEQALIRARARRAAAEAAGEPAREADADVDADADVTIIDATPHLDLVSPEDDQPRRHDAERPLGGT